jgi:hypothetical protein
VGRCDGRERKPFSTIKRRVKAIELELTVPAFSKTQPEKQLELEVEVGISRERSRVCRWV